MRNLHLVNSYIRDIKPEWDRFKDSDTNFANLDLFAYTGGDGMVGVTYGIITSNELLTVSNFLQNTKPPRPLYLRALRVTYDFEVITNRGSLDK